MSKKSEIGIIFIHGAGLDGRIWQGVKEQLALPFVCVDYSSLHSKAKLNDYVALAYNQATNLNVNKILVVAHSIGGVVGTEVLKRLGDRVAGFMGVSAAITKPGNNFVSTLPYPQKLIMPIILKFAGTKPPESAIRKGLCGDLNDEQAEDIIANFKQESVGLYLDKTSSSAMPQVPTFYIRTHKDKEFDIKVQDSMIEKLPNAKVFDIDSGHMPMLSHPELVAKYLSVVLEKL